MVRFDNLSPMAAQPTNISRYEIKSRIGRGGMGDLYLASDPNTNRLVAIKLLNATLDSTELRERFAREARALATLNHPNIVGIYDTGEFEDSPFIVMEYVRGETLAELIKRRASLSVSQKLKLMEELCAGLSQAHEAGIIHRDVKPANLMVDQQNHLKILDFGIARVAEGNRTRIGLPLTAMNMSIGTPGYMSPEQIEGGEVDHRSDIFAVGAVCYELLAYDEAFSGANTGQIESRVMRGTPRPLASLVPGLDPEIDEIILRALKTDPNKRYQDAATFQRALERYRLRLEPDAADASPRATPPPPPSSRGKTREARAEAAYQRALASYQSGSRDAARRFAVEAIAEDSAHPGARALLGRLEKRPSETPVAPPPRDNRPPAVRTAISDSAPTMISTKVPGSTASGSTAVSGAPFTSGSTTGPDSTLLPGSTMAAGGTFASGGTLVPGDTRASDQTRTSGPHAASDRRPTSASAPTIVAPPPKARSVPLSARMQSWFSGLGAGRASARARQQTAGRDGGSRQARQPFWIRYGNVTPIVALVVLVLLIGGGALLLISWLRPSGQVLTVTKPSGGTLSGSGVRCGTLGGDCSVRRPDGETVELTAQADPGFAFRGYTGDCAPGGLMVMNGAKTCGATFETIPVEPARPGGPTQTLTILPVPTGGTLEGIDIICGTKGSICTAQHPDGVPVELHPTADPGFTFMGFVGDCAPVGHTQMTAPRTCSATFSPTDSLKPGKDVVVRTPSRGGAPQTPSTPGTQTPTAPPVARGGTGTGTTRPPEAPSTPSLPPVAPPQTGQPPPPQTPPGEVKPPISDEDYAKNAVKDALKDYCAAYEAIDPDAVQRVYPKVIMAQLRLQLNKSLYKSIQCTFAEPKYDALDTVNGTAKIKVDVKRVFERTALGDKPEVFEYVATITFSRASQRGKWFVETAEYRPKPKEK
jgi:serine/threonine protein kinase